MNVNMDMFVNKLRSTVSQVAFTVNTSVNTVIPGNAINREYELIRKRGVYGCPGIHWEIHDAIKKTSSIIQSALGGSNTTGGSSQASSAHSSQSESHQRQHDAKLSQLYSAFIFEKRQLDRLSKGERDTVIEHIKKSVQQLTRLRHPSVLTVHHPLEESRSTLAFITEHVYGNVDCIIHAQHRNKGGPKLGSSAASKSSLVDLNNSSPQDNASNENECELDTVQIKAGLLQLCDGLRFLHRDAKLLHRNLCLDNIFINSNFVWKIAGFDFCTGPAAVSDQIDDVQKFSSLRDIHNHLPSQLVPNWSYSAPEHSNSDSVTISSDIYSLGLIACVAFNFEKYTDLGYEVGLLSDTYKRGITTRELLDELGPNLRQALHKFVSLNAGTRPNLDDFSRLSIFEDLQVQTLRCLDATFTWDNVKKVQFYASLKDILPQLSHKVKVNRVAASLVREFVDPSMIVHVLPNVLMIAKETTPSEFKTRIFPKLIDVFRLMDPVAVPLMLLESLPALTQRASSFMSLYREHSMALIFAALESGHQQLQEQTLTIMPSLKALLDNANVKERLLPCLRQVCHGTTVLSIRVKCLVCLGKIIDIIDKWLVTDQVLPLLRDVPSREPAVIMSSVGVIKVIMASGASLRPSKEVIATVIIPFLMPFCVERDLNLQQFQSINSLIKELMKVVEDEQITKLKNKSNQMASSSGPMTLVDQYSSLNAMMSSKSFTSSPLTDGAVKHIDSLKLLD